MGDDRGREGFKLFIGGLNSQTKNDALQDYFGKYGQLVDFVVMKRREAVENRGFGFVTYKNLLDRDACLNDGPHTLDGKTVEVKKAVPKDSDGNRTKRIYVGGLPLDATEDDIRDGLEEVNVGTKISDIKLITEKETEKSRGFAFVTFNEYDDVDDMMVIRRFVVKDRQVEVKKAVPKGEMNAKKPGGRPFDDDRRDGGYGGRGGRGSRDEGYGDHRMSGLDYGRHPGEGGGYMNNGRSYDRISAQSYAPSGGYGGGSSYSGGGGGYGGGGGGSGGGGGGYGGGGSGGYGGSGSGGYGGGGGGGRYQSQSYYDSPSYGFNQSGGGGGAMGSYSQSASSYGPSRGGAYGDKGGGYHPYRR